MTRKEVITHPTQETRLQIKYNKKLEGIPTKEVLTLYNQTLKKKKTLTNNRNRSAKIT